MNRHNGNEEWEQGIGMETGMGTGNEEQGMGNGEVKKLVLFVN